MKSDLAFFVGCNYILSFSFLLFLFYFNDYLISLTDHNIINIDTYEKRKNLVFIIIVACSLIFSFMHILLGITLLPIQSYDDVLSLVDQSLIQQAFFGRNALELLNIQVLDMTGYLLHLFSLKGFEWIFFVGNCLCLFTSKKKYGYFNLLIFKTYLSF